MKLFKVLCLGLACFVLTSCDVAGKKSVKANVNSGTKPNDVNTNVDVLKNKQIPEVVKIKYGGDGALLVTCELKSLHLGRDIVIDRSAKAEVPDALAIYRITDNRMIYDLRTQLRLDPILSKEASISLENNFIENNKIEINLTFSPIRFSDLLNITIENKRYVMKYTPRLFLNFDYRILSGESTVSDGIGEGTILEKIEKSFALKKQDLGSEQYEHQLVCYMNTKTNGQNPQNKDELASQWKCSGCKSN